MSVYEHFVPGPELMGWGEPNETTYQKHYKERSFYDTFASDYPRGYSSKAIGQALNPEAVTAFNKLQESLDIDPRSKSLTLMTQWAFGKRFWWLPQDGGTCVWSNTFRRIVDAMIIQVSLFGEPSAYFGSDQFSPKSIAPHCISYGLARERAKMKGGWGLYASPMAESMLKDGFLLCSNPKLQEVMQQVNELKDTGYPEPRNLRVYSAIGDWKYNSLLRPYCDFRALEMTRIENADQLLKAINEYRVGYICSSMAIKPNGKDPDGFTIHTQNMGDRWDHNMGIGGTRVNSRGNIYIEIDNDSWVQPGEQNPGRYNYLLPIEFMEKKFKQNALDIYMIGRIDLPAPVPLT